MKTGQRPNIYDRIIERNVYYYVVNYNIRFDKEIGAFRWDFVKVNNLNYGEIVDALIRRKYPNDKMQAIMNNYLMDQTDEHIAEFLEMQEWRKFAKSYAKSIVE